MGAFENNFGKKGVSVHIYSADLQDAIQVNGVLKYIHRLSQGIAVTQVYHPLLKTRTIDPVRYYPDVTVMPPGQVVAMMRRSIIHCRPKYSPRLMVFAEVASISLPRVWKMLTAYYSKRHTYG